MSDPMGPVAGPEDEHATARTTRRRRDLRIAVTGAVAVLLVWFAVANLQDVTIRFWVTTTSASLIVVIAISGCLGAAVGGLAGRARRRRDGGS